MSALQRPALGERASIGDLYDARRDQFLVGSIVNGPPGDGAIFENAMHEVKHVFSDNDSLKEKLAKMGLNADLRASFLAGMVLSKAPPITARHGRMDFASPSLQATLNLSSLHTSKATHVVTPIHWGGRCIVSARRQMRSGEDRTVCEVDMEKSFRGFEDVLAWSDGLSKTYGRTQSFEAGQEPGLEVNLHSDFPEHKDDTGTVSLGAAFGWAKSLEKVVKDSPSRYGQPIVYTPLPIGFLITLGAAVPHMTPVGQLSAECLEKFVGLMDELALVQQSLAAYHRTLEPLAAVVRQGHLVEVMQSDAAPSKLMQITEEYAEKLEFISMAVNGGATYLPLAGPALKEVKKKLPRRGTTCVFFFNSDVMKKDQTWNSNVELLQELFNSQGDQSILIADCLTDTTLERPFISTYSDGEVTSKDLLEERQMLATKHLIAFGEGHPRQVKNMPMARKAAVFPCPGQNCDKRTSLEWTCFKCYLSMEYSPSDNYFYCDCGQIRVDAVEFNCQRPEHRGGYAKYRRSALTQQLESLPAPREINILILGETGVGKSTFINAFVNYLSFSSLDEAIDASRLHWLIPCSFTTQLTEPRTGRLISKDIKMGFDKDENDGSSGSSATQQATVYPIYIGGDLVRLIDTPGIGDTRGIEQDKENLANVLSVLRNYSNLHGILILLKPNNARLNVMFRFCVKELLGSLHRSAAGNIAFGFTNTRGSNYKPGDTFKPLQELLLEYNDVIPGLFDYNVFCFDSESFRHLAAKQQGIDMGHIEDYRRSWDQSTHESDRLMGYIRTLKPHSVKQTLSLNETRYLIAQLVASMQQISRAISDSITSSEKQATELNSAKLSGKDLMTRLQTRKVVVEATPLTQPKTVCSNIDCVQPVVNSTDGNTVLLRKHLCHNPCCLTDVPPGKVGTMELKRCWAFQGNTPCKVCGHAWQEHEHIVVEFSSRSETTVNPEVERQLKTNGNVVKAKEVALSDLHTQIAELKAEHLFIQEAAAKFSIYMKHNSITHYNDATIEYMDHLLKDERSKLRAGASRARLDALERDKAQYQSFVDAMESTMTSTSRGGRAATLALSERGIAALVHELYALTHYGAMLRGLAKVVRRAYEANFRERPYHVRRRRLGHGGQAGRWQRGEAGGASAGAGAGSGHVLRIPIRSPLALPHAMKRAAAVPSGLPAAGYRSMLDVDGSDSEHDLPAEAADHSSRASLMSKLRKSFKVPGHERTGSTADRGLFSLSRRRQAESSADQPAPELTQSSTDWAEDSLGCHTAAATASSQASFGTSQRTNADYEPSITSSAPPPYTEMGTSVVQRGGIWSRVKNKLNK